MDAHKRIAEIDSQLKRQEDEPLPTLNGDVDEVDSHIRSVRFGELEGEKRGLEAQLVA